MEDFDELLDGVERSVLAAITEAIDRADTVEPELDREFWRGRKEGVKRLDKAARRALADVDWSRHGNLRGLSTTVEQIIANGRSPVAVLEELPIVGAEQHASARDGLLERLLQVARPGEGLAGQVKAVEVQLRDELRAHLSSDRLLRRQLARQMNLSEQQLSAQLRELARRRLKPEDTGQ
jgi:DNA-binding NtrC family response regulator